MADIGTKHKGIERRDCVVWETHNMAAGQSDRLINIINCVHAKSQLIQSRYKYNTRVALWPVNAMIFSDTLSIYNN